MEESKIKIIFLEQADEFLNSLPETSRKKILYNIGKVQIGIKDSELFTKLGDSGIWEFRTYYNNEWYRLFSFWDTETETLIIATHGIKKKSNKTPQKEITKAQEIKKLYFENKKDQNNENDR